VQSFALYLKGKESHAAEPERGNNPAQAIAAIVNALAKLNAPEPTKAEFAILTPVHITMGEKAYGISPGTGELHYTIRTWSGDVINRLKQQLEAEIKSTCQTYQLNYEMDWFEYFPASINDNSCNQYISAAAAEGGFQVIERHYPFKFGEDFGWYSKAYKTAMFGLGAGTDSPALHHADYDFPDAIIPTGIQMFTALIERVMALVIHPQP
jgi:metal-dependent amidase/aminoacylase/carboxypeptidase family protein